MRSMRLAFAILLAILLEGCAYHGYSGTYGSYGSYGVNSTYRPAIGGTYYYRDYSPAPHFHGHNPHRHEAERHRHWQGSSGWGGRDSFRHGGGEHNWGEHSGRHSPGFRERH